MFYLRKFALLLLLIFFLCGCEDITQAKPETRNLSFTAVTVFENTEYVLSCNTDENSNLHLTVNKPDNIANLKMFFADKNVKIDYLELEKEIPLNSLESASVLRILYEGILKASKTENLLVEDDIYFVPFSLQGENYFFYFGQSGLPLEIKSKDNKLQIFIKGVTILN